MHLVIAWSVKRISIIRVMALLLISACIAGCAMMQEHTPGYDTFLENSATVLQAKRTYAIGYNVSNGTSVSWADLATCLPANWKPLCPQGGKLTPGPIGEQMQCTYHGQLPSAE